MNGKLITFFVAVIGLLAVTALNCQDVMATARATVTPLWSHVKAEAKWGNSGGSAGDFEEWTCPPHTPDPPCYAFATRGDPPGTRSRAHALAWRGQQPKAAVSSFLKVLPGDWAHAKGFDSLTVSDTVDCSIRHLSGSSYRLRAKGLIRVFPAGAPMQLDWADIELRVHENGGEESSFWGAIALTGYGSSPRGDFIGWTLHDSLLADGSRQVSFDDSVTLTYTGVQDSLVLDLLAKDFAANVPTMTQWGIVILVALIMGSAVFIMVRRRRAAVPA
jgi:hypothetical protein